VLESPVVNTLRENLVNEEKEVASLSERYLEKHPQRVAAEEKLRLVRERLAAESVAVVESMRSEYRTALTTEQRLKDLIEGVKAEAFELNKKEIDYKKLGREQSNNQRLYDLVLSRLKEADLTGLLKANNVRKLEAGLEPGAPIKPRPGMIFFITFVLSALAAVGVAVLAEILDRTLKNEDDVERTLGVPFLGMVPSLANPVGRRGRKQLEDANRDLFVFNNPKSAAAECCRAIRTNLLFMSPDRELKRIAVTSSGPQEGKTTTCINVGVAMAQAGSRVLLIDTDMRRPRLHRAFGLSNEIGLSTVVVGETPVESAVKTTDVPNLFVLPCGPVPPNPAELLHTERFREVLGQVADRFDRIVFDTPPLIAVADAAVLSTAVDGVMLVTRFRKTTRDVARRVLRSLRDVNAPVLGVVMNDVDLESREYGYYYYRRYGYYYGESSESGAKA
jgi:capsular exopolysaccharide synthesis family protein